MESEAEKNLARLAQTDIAAKFVESRNGSWNHQEWLDFLSGIKEYGYDPIDLTQVGLLLEKQKAEYLASGQDFK